MTIFENFITIDAPAAVVRQVFIDFYAWSEWNPLYGYMRVVGGDIKLLNTKVEIETAVKITSYLNTKGIISPDNNTMDKIEWRGKQLSSCVLSFVVTNLFITVDSNKNQTEYRRIEEWSGCISGLANCFIGNLIRESAGEMCVALKNRCEKYTNLSNTLNVNIQKIFVPLNEEDVCQIISGNLEQNQNKKLLFRPFGGRHSWAPVVVSDNDESIILLDTSQMKKPLEYVQMPLSTSTPNDVDTIKLNGEAIHLLRLGVGVEPGEMATLAAKNNRCLPETGALQFSIRIGGFLAAGCHGTGKDLPPVSDFVRAIRMVVVNSKWFPNTNQNVGAVVFTDIENFPKQYLKNAILIDNSDLRIRNDENIMDYVRVHFGALGIITEVFIQTTPNFFVNAVDEVLLLEKVIPRPDSGDNTFVTDFYEPNTYLELFYSPFNYLDKHPPYLPQPGYIWVKRANQAAPTCCSKIEFANSKHDLLDFHENVFNNWFNDTVQANGDKLESLFVDNPTALTPEALQNIGNLAYGLGLNPTCSGIFGCLGLVLNIDRSTSYNVPFNQFSLYQRDAPKGIVDCEMEIPLSLKRDPELRCFRRVWWSIIDRVRELAAQGKFPLNLTLHCRFNKCSSSLLSSCYSTDSEMRFATLEFLSVTGNEKTSNYRQYLSEFQNEFMNTLLATNDSLLEQSSTVSNANELNLTPRPHFAKSWYNIRNVESKVGEVFHDNILAFDDIRQIVDPQNIFYGGLFPRLMIMTKNSTSSNKLSRNDQYNNNNNNMPKKVEGKGRK